jgi:outer membrane protein assembly factor BamB
MLLVSSNSDEPTDAQWRGENRDGHYTGAKLLKEWPADGPKLIWNNEELGAGYSAPSVTADAVYVTGTESQVEYLYSLGKNGKVQWKTEMGASFQGDFPLARCTPTVKNGHVYVVSSAGKISCIDDKSGKTKWSVDAYKKFEGSHGIWGTSENLLVDDNMVVYTPGGEKTTLVALNAESGETVWQTKSLKDKSAYASAIVFDHAGRKVFSNVTASYIFGVEASSGELLWQYNYGTLEAPPIEWGAPYVNTVTPIYKDGHIYTTSGYNHVGALFKLANDGRGISVAWTDKTLDTHHGGVVLVDGYIYGANWINNRSGNWCSIDWKTGKPGYETTWNTKGSIIYADGMLYCYEEKRGTVGLVKATPEKFDVVSSFLVTQGSGPHWAHPVIKDGVLYIRHGKALMAYDIRAGS